MTGFDIIAVSAEPVNTFYNDSTSPELNVFAQVDLNYGSITLEFSEVIDFDTFHPEYITLQNLFEPPHEQLNLTGGDPIQITLNTVQVNFSMFDLYNLKRDPYICTYRGNCYITASSHLVQDTAGNLFASVPLSEPGIIVQMFITDSMDPELDSYELDLDSNQLKLLFNEPIDTESLDVTGFTLQAFANVSLESERYTLNDADVYSIDAVTIMLNLSDYDANVIKAKDFATKMSNTYLRIAEAAAYDLATSQNPIAATAVGTQVQLFTSDSTPPMLEGFTLDLQLDTLTLTFDEPVRVSTFIFSGITLKSNCTAGSNYTLTGGSFIPEDVEDGVIEVTIAISYTDLIGIKSDVNLATDTDSTFLEIIEAAVEDMASESIGYIACAPTTIVTLDSIHLMLLAFDVDMHSGSFALTFSDVVDAHSWNPTAIQFQSEQTAIEGVTYRLTSGSTSLSTNGYSIAVSLSDQDLFGIKSIENLATTENNTYITVQSICY